jgi:glycosyltransferase domain-containing protein
MNEQCTVVILTTNRPDKLDRSLSYYSDKDIKVIVVDNSDDRFEKIDKYSDIDYRFLPGKNRVYRFISVLKDIKTKYVMHLADDDFVVIESILPCLEFLEEHTDYIYCSGGYEYRFAVINNQLYYNLDTIIDYNNENDLSILRIGNQKQTPYYGVYKTETLSKFYGTLNELPSEIFDSKAWNGYIHIALNVIMPGLGKLKQLNIPFLIRENDYGDKSLSIPNSILQNDITEDFISCLSSNIISFLIQQNKIDDEGIDIVKARITKLYAMDMLVHLSNFYNPNRTTQKRLFVKKYLPSYEIWLHDMYRRYQILRDSIRSLKSTRLRNGFVSLRKNKEAQILLKHIRDYNS